MAAKFRKIVFTDEQMLDARDSGKFKDHRDLISFLFDKQHNAHVEDFTKLIYYKEPSKSGLLIWTVEGLVGHAIVLK